MNTILVESLVLSILTAPLPVAFEPPPTPKAAPTADEEVRAKELFENGKELYLGGSYVAAITALKEAYALSGDPLLLYNIYQAYDRIGEYDAAIEYVEYYQAFAPEEERAELTTTLESLRRRKLKAQSDEPEPPSPTEAVAVEDDEAARADRGPRPTLATDGEKARVFTPVAIGLTVGAVAALGAGIGLGFASSRRTSDAEQYCGGSPLVCSAQADGDLDGARNLAIGANVSFAVAGLAAIGAVIVVAVNAKRRKSRGGAAARVELQPAPSGLRLRF